MVRYGCANERAKGADSLRRVGGSALGMASRNVRRITTEEIGVCWRRSKQTIQDRVALLATIYEKSSRQHHRRD